MKTEQQIKQAREDLTKGFEEFKKLLNEETINPSNNEFLTIISSSATFATVIDWVLDDSDKTFDEYYDENKKAEMKEEFNI